MLARISPILLTATLTASLALAGPAGDGDVARSGDGGCVLDGASASLALVTPMLGQGGSVVMVAAPASGDASATALDFGCAGGVLDFVSARLTSRQETELTLLLGNTRRVPLAFRLAPLPARAGETQWLTVDPGSGTIPAGGQIAARVSVRAPEELAPGSGYRQTLRFTVDDGAMEVTTDVGVFLEVQEDAPMFRDDFSDPVIGQFSYVTGH